MSRNRTSIVQMQNMSRTVVVANEAAIVVLADRDVADPEVAAVVDAAGADPDAGQVAAAAASLRAAEN